MKPSLMPSSARVFPGASAADAWWLPGCVTRLLASPRLFEIRASFRRVEAAEGAGLAALHFEAEPASEPAAPLLLLTNAACG